MAMLCQIYCVLLEWQGRAMLCKTYCVVLGWQGRAMLYKTSSTKTSQY